MIPLLAALLLSQVTTSSAACADAAEAVRTSSASGWHRQYLLARVSSVCWEGAAAKRLAEIDALRDQLADKNKTIDALLRERLLLPACPSTTDGDGVPAWVAWTAGVAGLVTGAVGAGLLCVELGGGP